MGRPDGGATTTCTPYCVIRQPSFARSSAPGSQFQTAEYYKNAWMRTRIVGLVYRHGSMVVMASACRHPTSAYA